MKVLAENKKFIGFVTAGLIASAALWEGTKQTTYLDIGKVPTVCMGHTGDDVVVGKTYSIDECNALIRKDLSEHGNRILPCFTKPLTEYQYNAYTLFALNVGSNAVCNSRSVKLFNLGQYSQACNAIAYGPDGKPVWSYVGTTFVKGLHNRRLYERSMCLGATSAYPN